jgi:NitT/TauT family transport system permease protein
MKSRIVVSLIQLGLVLGGLALWQWIPSIPILAGLSPVFDPFVISSPTRVAEELWRLSTGAENSITIWPFLWATVKATLLGTAGGIVVGATSGLLLSNSDAANRVFRPFIVALNAVPRIALIPVIVILFGPTLTASAVTSFIIVVFIVFFNAYEGGRSIAPQMIQNARILGANDVSIIWRVRLPYVLAWTFAALPNAVSFGLVGVVTAEILTGSQGVGRVLVIALSTVNATQTMAVTVTLALVGMVLVGSTSLIRGRLLHWWDEGGTAA